jgi:hypothetical protein
MILAAVWKLKQNGGGYGLPGTYDQARELAAIDASIQILEFCGQRNPFARRYSILIKELQRQLVIGLSSKASPSSAVPDSSMSSSASVTDSDPAVESPYFQNLRISVEQNSGTPMGLSRTFVGRASYPSVSPSNMDLEGWLPSQFGTLSPGDEESYGTSILPSYHNALLYNVYTHTYLRADPTSSFFLQPDGHNFWGEMRE